MAKITLLLLAFSCCINSVYGQKGNNAQKDNKETYTPCSISIEFFRTEKTNQERKDNRKIKETWTKEYKLNMQSSKAMLSSIDGNIHVEIDPGNEALNRAGQKLLQGSATYSVTGDNHNESECYVNGRKMMDETDIHSTAAGNAGAAKMSMRFDFYTGNKSSAFSMDLDGKEEAIAGDGSTRTSIKSCNGNQDQTDNTIASVEKLAAAVIFSSAFTSDNKSTMIDNAERAGRNSSNQPSQANINEAIRAAEKFLTPEQKAAYDKAMAENREQEMRNEHAARERTMRDAPSTANPEKGAKEQWQKTGWGDILHTVKTSSGYTVTYFTEVQDYDKEENRTVAYVTSLRVTIITKPVKLRALIVHANENRKAYEEWIPEGLLLPDSTPADNDGRLRKQYKRGNCLPLKVILVKADQPLVNVSNQYRFTVKYYLRDVTKYKGYACNYPVEGGTTENDLKFDNLSMTGDKFAVANEDRAETKKGLGSFSTVNIISYDYGSYGRLSAEVYLENENMTLVAEDEKNEGQAYLSIPFDKNNNKIADIWETQKHILSKNYAFDADPETTPNPNLKGDGLLLIDEYRGVAGIKGNERKITRLEPEECDGFYQLINTQRVGQIESGVKRFEELTQIKLHRVADKSFLGKSKRPHSIAGKTVVNVNKYGDDYYEIGAVPILVDYGEGDHANTNGLTSLYDDYKSISPDITERLMLGNLASTLTKDMDLLAPPVTGSFLLRGDTILKSRGIDIQLQNGTAINTGIRLLEKLKDQCSIFNVFHELGHAFGMQHHFIEVVQAAPNCPDNDCMGPFWSKGPNNCPTRYWLHTPTRPEDFLLFMTGRFDCSKTDGFGTPLEYCSTCRSKVHFYEKF